MQTLKKKIVTKEGALAELCRRSLYRFLKEFWGEIIDNEYVGNWHIKWLCDFLQPHLLKALRNEPKEFDIIINICPGTTKSTIVSQMIPAWCWAVHPESVILTSTNDRTLSTKNATRSRDIILSEKYQKLFPDVKIRSDVSAKQFYQNTAKGARYSFTTKGSKIGNHGNVLIDDDPTTALQAKRTEEMKTAIEGWKAYQTRKISKSSGLYILLMQRLEENDMTTHALKNLSNVFHICLPANDSDLVKPSYLREKYVDGLLDPVRLSKEVLEQEKKALNNEEEGTSEFDYDAQYEQDPKNPKGLLYPVINYYEGDTPDGVTLSFTDVADRGDDYLCTWFVRVNDNGIYVFDAIYTKDGSDVTIPLMEKRINIYNCVLNWIETNNQGSVFVSQLTGKVANIDGQYTTSNKVSRLHAYAWAVKFIHFKKTGSDEYLKAIKHMKSIKKVIPNNGKGMDIDSADALTALLRYFYENYPQYFIIQ